MVSTEVFHAVAGVAADTGQRRRSLRLDHMIKGAVEPGAEGMTKGVKVEGDARLGAHQKHLDWLNWSPILFHLGEKFNNKTEAQDFVLGGLSFCAGIAGKDQLVLARLDAVCRNNQVQLLIGE